MALILNDRVKETTTTNGTSDFALAGAETGFQSFSAGVGANNTTYYSVTDNTDWEVGLGTLSSDGLTLARTSVLQSSNSDAKVDFASGIKRIFVTYPADKAVLSDATQTLTNKTFGNPTVVDVNSSSTALRITQTGSGNALRVEDSANPDSTPFVVDASGNVGVKTSTMTGTFNVVGNSFFGNFATAPSVNIQRAEGSASSPTVVSSGQTLGQYLFNGYDGSAYILGAQIAAAVDGTPGTNDMPGRLVFSTTADGASSPTERMRIDNAGNVGIGATPLAGRTFTVSKNVTGSVSGYSINVQGQIQSDVTSYFGVRTQLTTAASAFTLTNATLFYADQGTIGATSAVTNQYGYYAASSLTGATNNYGFYSDIASGSGRWNFYAAGTAANYFGGVTKFAKATQETKTAIAASDIDLSTGNYFTKTISGATTFTVSNVASSGLVSAFVLDLTNGGAAAVTWFSGVKWNGGTAPTLTASGRDVLAFFTYDGGTTWNAFVLGQAMA